jgi:anthranilate synthase component 1
MNQQEFAALAAQGYNRIPVSTEVLADLETPISAYRKLAEGPYSFFFESVQGGEKWGRYSIIGLPCRTLLKVFDHRAEVWVDGEITETEEVEDPLAHAEAFQGRYQTAPREDLPVFHGGLVGYFGYDTVRYVEPKLAASVPPDRLGTPDILLMVSEEVLVFDNLAGTIRLVVNADPAAGESRGIGFHQGDVRGWRR